MRLKLRHRALLAAACLYALGCQAQEVYRCGNTYTQEPCKGGKPVDVSPAFSDLSGPKTTVIYLCRAPGGSLYWIPEKCIARGWSLERSATVSSGISWDNQVEEARRQRAEAQELTRSPTLVFGEAASPTKTALSAELKAQ